VERLMALALTSGFESGARLSQREGIAASGDTLLRLVRRFASVERATPQAVGIDDWAWRKGQRYGTILCNLETHEVVELLPEREAETVVAWLQAHPDIAVIARDRAVGYADAATRGAPQAHQVADRWHLLKNVSDTVFKILQQEQATIHQRLRPAAAQPALDLVQVEPSEPALPIGLEELTVAERRRKERMELAHQLYEQGWTKKGIAAHLAVHPRTIRRDLQQATFTLRRPRHVRRRLDPFKGYLLERWNEGCHNASHLFREIQPQGYAGKLTTVQDFIRRLRQASALPPGVRSQPGHRLDGDPTQRPPSLRTLTWWMVKHPDKRRPEDERLLAQLVADHPKLTTTLGLARQFAEIVRQQQPEQLDSWLIQASASGFQTWKNFAASLQQDDQAVRAALREAWSNGPTEGHINRLKTLKRQMYGRAGLDLLRIRLLHPP
jgi:transposase